MREAILKHRVEWTEYLVMFEYLRDRWVVEAHTIIPARVLGTPPSSTWSILGPDDEPPELDCREIQAVNEKWHVSFDRCLFGGDTQNQATEALAAAMLKIQPKVEENERRRLAGEQTLQEYEAELHREERERQGELRYLAEAAAREAERQQLELEKLPCYGIF